MNSLKLKTLIVLFSLCVNIGHAQEKIVTEKYSDVINKMQKYISEKMKDNKVAGLSIALVDDQDIVWAQGFGYADKEKQIPATTKTCYRVGSISKVFTVTGALQLVDQGKIDIDKPYSHYVPEFQIKTRYKDKGEITPRNLMTHHSGLPSDVLCGFAPREEPKHYSTVVDDLNNMYTCFPPNYIYSYSNVGMSLVGFLTEKVSKQPFVGYMDNHVFAPLEMKNSSFEVNESMEKLMSKSYRGKKEAIDINIREMPAGLMVSNVLDMSNFMKMIFNNGKFKGKTILREETVGEMLKVQNENIPFDMKMKTGLAWFRSDIHFNDLKKAGRYAEHGGDTELFHASLSSLLDQKLAVIVLTNTDMGGVIKDDIAGEVLRLAYSKKIGKEIKKEEYTKPEFVKEHNIDLAQHEGCYAFYGGYFDLKQKKNKLKGKLRIFGVEFIPNKENNYTFRVKLLGIPVYSEAGYNFLEIENQKIIALDSFSVFATKYAKNKIPKAWQNRVGKFHAINGIGELAAYTDTKLLNIDGMLVFEGKTMGEKIQLVLQPINDTEAVFYGLGRNLGETVFITKDENGNEILNFSGFKSSKTANIGHKSIK